MQIRTFEKKDGENVKDLIVSILSREYPFDKKVYENSDLSDIASTYGGTRNIFYVIESDDEIIGTLGIKEDSKDTALMRRLFVKSSSRRKGCGSLLVNKAIAHCRRKNFKHMVFRATGKMIQAINLIKKVGFKEIEKIDLGGFEIYKFNFDL